MNASRTVMLTAAAAALICVSMAEAGPFRDRSDARPIFGGAFSRLFGGRLFRGSQQAPATPQEAPSASTAEPPMADAPVPPAKAPTPTPAAPAAAKRLPAGKTIEPPFAVLPAGPAPGVDAPAPPSR